MTFPCPVYRISILILFPTKPRPKIFLLPRDSNAIFLFAFCHDPLRLFYVPPTSSILFQRCHKICYLSHSNNCLTPYRTAQFVVSQLLWSFPLYTNQLEHVENFQELTMELIYVLYTHPRTMGNNNKVIAFMQTSLTNKRTFTKLGKV